MDEVEWAESLPATLQNPCSRPRQQTVAGIGAGDGRGVEYAALQRAVRIRASNAIAESGPDPVIEVAERIGLASRLGADGRDQGRVDLQTQADVTPLPPM